MKTYTKTHRMWQCFVYVFANDKWGYAYVCDTPDCCDSSSGGFRSSAGARAAWDRAFDPDNDSDWKSN